jgi:beta-phosphoglucomutase
MLKAVIFDFDGVIADSEPLHFRTFKQTLNAYGIDISKQRYYTDYLGYADIECARAISADFNLNLDEKGIYELVRRKTQLFDELVKIESAIIDGVPEFIDMLNQNSIPIAVCSGAFLSDIHLMLQNTDLAHSFDIIVAADHVKKGKPDPEGLLLTLERLNKTGPNEILPGHCVVVEDSHWGLEAAMAARMHTIAVTNTYPAEQLQQFTQRVVSRLTDLAVSDLQNLCAD